MDFLAIAKVTMEAIKDHYLLYETCTCEDPPEEQPSRCWYHLNYEEQMEVTARYVASQLELTFG